MIEWDRVAHWWDKNGVSKKKKKNNGVSVRTPEKNQFSVQKIMQQIPT